MSAMEWKVRYLSILSILMVIFPGVFLVHGADPIPDDLSVVTGIVRDVDNLPIDGANVSAEDHGGQFLNKTTTSSDGSFFMNISYEGQIMLTIIKSGYFDYYANGFATYGKLVYINSSLEKLPPADEEVKGHVVFEEDGSNAVGVTVQLKHGDSSFYDITDEYGEYSFLVSPAMYELIITYHGFLVDWAIIFVTEGGSPYVYNSTIRNIPPMDTMVKGYITDGADPIPAIKIEVNDEWGYMEHKTGWTDVNGYYEVPFYSGTFTFRIEFTDDYEYEDTIDLLSGEVLWYNHTKLSLDYQISGTIVNETGVPDEYANMDYYMEHISLYNLDIDEEGHYSVMVPEGKGYLIAWDSIELEIDEGGGIINTLYLGSTDTFIKEMEVMDDVTLDIALTDEDVNKDYNNFTFNGWDSVKMESHRYLSRSSTVDMRIDVDEDAGDNDNYVDQEEVDRYYEAYFEYMHDEESANTTEYFMLDGTDFHLDSGSIDHSGIEGEYDDPVHASEVFGADYAYNGEVQESLSHDLSMNIYFDNEDIDTEWNILIPEGWTLFRYESVYSDVSSVGNLITLKPWMENYLDDDIYDETVNLTLYPDILSIATMVAGPINEGVAKNFSWNITDSFPTNDYSINIEFGDGSTFEGPIDNQQHTYADNGVYLMKVDLTDRMGRTAHCETNITVRNVAPTLEISAKDLINNTCNEGDEVEITAIAVDVASDPLLISWSTNGTFSDFVNITGNRTFVLTVADVGNNTIYACVVDQDGGRTELDLTLNASNVAPHLAADFIPLRIDGKVYEMEPVRIEVNASDPTLSEVVPITITVTPGSDYTITAVTEGKEYLVLFKKTGVYTIVVTGTDPDGGTVEKTQTYTVLMNETLDHDGDGIPMKWEKDNGLSDADATDAGKDKDGDGLSNLEEYQKGSDPNDENSPKKQGGKTDLTILWIVLGIILILVVVGIFLVMQRKGKKEEEE